MPLTTVVGSSGSGKTTFLNDVHKFHKCIYIRQYHNLRPYVTVSKVPNFDPTELPYWDIYVKEEKADTIQIGGTMGGEVTSGLSGGQRKLFLFELIYQRTKHQDGLLILLDEPFAGVTDNFLPWILDRLKRMSQNHNIVLVTNDHVKGLTEHSNNTLSLSAVDRSTVQVAEKQVDRDMAIVALSVGGSYAYTATDTDFQFFLDVELINNQGIKTLLWHAFFAFGLFLLTFWGVDQDSAALVLVANDMIGYFVVKPYLLSLVDWRHYIAEESEALLHSSKGQYKLWKSCLAMTMVFVIALVEYGLVNVVIKGLESFDFFWAIFFDSGSNSFAFIFFGLYSTLANETVYTISSLPFLLMIFFSTTFAPGSGLPVLKEFRYLFSRFYFWCMTPGVQNRMEGCPANHDVNMFLLAFTGCLIVWIFLGVMVYKALTKQAKASKKEKLKESMLNESAFQALQLSLFGEQLGRWQAKPTAFQNNESISYGTRREGDDSDWSATTKDETKEEVIDFCHAEPLWPNAASEGMEIEV